MNEREIKPVVSIWVLLSNVDRLKKGELPVSWRTEIFTLDALKQKEYVNIFVPYDYFINLYDKRLELERDTSDLPF